MNSGDIISYLMMCNNEGVNLQRGMNYKLKGGLSVILMSIRPGAPYYDKVENDGKVLIYEGHDVPKTSEIKDSKALDQPMHTPSGKLTQNGIFFEAAKRYKDGEDDPELVKVYEKIKNGIWVYNGIFKLTDAWIEKQDNRYVFKFKLELTEDSICTSKILEIHHTRLIPTSVKMEVWKRDKGKCVTCGSSDNLHFDHIIPFSKGGSSLIADNIQLLCARHNLEKRDRII